MSQVKAEIMLYKILILLFISTVAFGQFKSEHTGEHSDSVITGAETFVYPTLSPSFWIGQGADSTVDVVSKGAFQDTTGITRKIFVASSEAPDIVKNSADYVCDGSNDEVQINLAINALTSYTRLTLSAGTFFIEAALDTIAVDNVIIEGEGWGTIIKRTASFRFKASHVNNVTFRDMRFMVASNGFRGGHLIFGEGSTNIWVDNIRADSCFLYAVNFANTTNYKVSNCVVSFSNGDDGIVSHNCTNTQFLFNIAHDMELGVGSPSGLEVEDGSGQTLIMGNVTYNNATSGIGVHTHDGNNTMTELIITNNISHSNTNNIDVAGLSADTLINKIIISNNILYDATGGGAGRHIDLTDVSFANIVGNTLSKTGIIEIVDCFDINVSSNITDSVGISIITSDRVKISGNMMTDGSRITTNQANIVQINGNTISGDSSNVLIGIAGSSTNITVTGNDLRNGTYGIQVSSGLDITVINNYIEDCGQGVNMQEDFSNVVRGNTIKNCTTSNLNNLAIDQYNNYSITYTNIIATADTAIVDKEDISSGSSILCTSASNIFTPRSIDLTVTDGDVSISAFQVRVYGRDIGGLAIIDTLNFADGLTQTNQRAFIDIDSVRVDGLVGNGAGDLLSVGTSSWIGLPYNFIHKTDILLINLDGGAHTLSSAEKDVTNNTLQLDLIDDTNFNIWIRVTDNNLKNVFQ